MSRTPREKIAGIEVYFTSESQSSPGGYKIQPLPKETSFLTLQGKKSSLSKTLKRANEAARILGVPIAYNRAPTLALAQGEEPLNGILDGTQIQQMILETRSNELKGRIKSLFLLIVAITTVSTFLWYHNLDLTQILGKL